MRRSIRILCVLVCLSAVACRSLFSRPRDYAERAEELVREEKYDEAIEAYRKHMNARLNVKDRPDWENPYLYLLTIGDAQLAQGKVDDALASYALAEKNQVGNGLVSDRFRNVAIYYEEHDRLQDAINVLQTYRDRDPLIFDGMLDRLSRKLVREEEASKNAPPIPSAKLPK